MKGEKFARSGFSQGVGIVPAGAKPQTVVGTSLANPSMTC
jgi:hypothetical protein